jgi:hypothetical protein
MAGVLTHKTVSREIYIGKVQGGVKHSFNNFSHNYRGTFSQANICHSNNQQQLSSFPHFGG